MDAATILRTARQQAGLSLRELAGRAHTSHATLAAYEAGRVIPTTGTLDRIVRAAGCAIDVTVTRRAAPASGRDDELQAVLRLAGQFPARHRPRLDLPVLGRATPR